MAITVCIPETFRIPRKTKLKHNKKRTKQKEFLKLKAKLKMS